MEISKEDIYRFSRKLINIQKPPVLWNGIRMDGNCFFHAFDYANTGKLLPKDSPKIIQMRQNVVSTMNKDMISGVTYEEFMNATKNGVKISWPYSELDVIIATSKYFKKTIIVISMDENGGVTMIRPKGQKINDPIFLICQTRIHYVPFHSNRVKITRQMRARLQHLEDIKKRDGALQYENGVYVSTFLLSELENLNSTRKSKSPTASRNSRTSKSPNKSRKKSIKRMNVSSKTNKTNSMMARSLQAKYIANYTKKLQIKQNGDLAKNLQMDEDAKLARQMERISRNHETAMEIYRRS